MAVSFISPNHLRDRRVLELYADDEYYAIVQFRAVDNNNAPLPDGTVANIDDQNDGRNISATNDDTPGTGRIVYLSDGIGAFKLLPSDTAKTFQLTISIDGQSDLTATIHYNEPTVNIYFVSSNDSTNPEWIDGIETGYAKLTIASDYFDIDGIEFDVNNRPVTLEYTDESSVSHTINTTTNSSGIVQQNFGPLTSSFTYEIIATVNFSFTAGNRTITVNEEETINVVFSRAPIVSLEAHPVGDYDTPFSLWADGRNATGSQDDFEITISYDYNNAYFSSAQFDIDNPVGVDVDYSVYDDEETLAIVSPVSGTFNSANTTLTTTVGPAIKTTKAQFKAAITDAFTITFGNKTISYDDNVIDEFSVNFVEPTFTLELEFNVGENPDNPISLSNNLFPDGSKKTGEGKIDLGGVRSFADNDLQFASKAIISSDYDDINPDKNNLINKNIKFESFKYTIDTFNDLVSNFDPNNDDTSFMNFEVSSEILDASDNFQDTVYSNTTYDAGDDEVFTYVTLKKQPSVGNKNVYIKIDATTSFDYTVGTRTLNIDEISYNGIVSYFPSAPRVSLEIQYHSDDPDDEENKLPADQSKHLFSLVRDGAVDADGKAIQPTEQPEPRRRPGKFTVSATDYLGNPLPADTDIIIRTNDAFNPLILNNVTSYTEKVCRFMFDNPLEMKDDLYITVETSHNKLSRSVTEKIPYFNAEDKEFYANDLFMRNIKSLTNGFSNNEIVVNSAMNELGYPFGQTPLYEAVFNAGIEYLDKLRDEDFDNKFLVLLTDGIENFSKVTQQDSIDKINSVEGKNKTRIYPISLGNISHISQVTLEDYAVDTGSYTDNLLEINLTTEIEDIINIIMNNNYKNISSTVRMLSRDFKEVIRMNQMEIDITIPSGYDLYVEIRSNSISSSNNSTDWSNWTTQKQLSSGVNNIDFEDELVGRYFEFRVTATPNNIEV
jgi:hypothetical protein